MNSEEQQVKLLMKYFRTIRVYAGWSRTAIAEKLGCTNSFIYYIEERNQPLKKMHLYAMKYLLQLTRDDNLDILFYILVESKGYSDDTRERISNAILSKFNKGRQTFDFLDKVRESVNLNNFLLERIDM